MVEVLLSKVVTLRLPHELHQRLVEVAKGRGISRNALIVEILGSAARPGHSTLPKGIKEALLDWIKVERGQ